MKPRPPSLYDREREWDDLVGFLTATGPNLRLGLLYGRRRYGKSYLLRRLVESVGGVYHLALQEERRSSLGRFADTVSRHQPGAPPLRFDGWSAALSYVVDFLGTQATEPTVLVLDEYPYLREASSELDSCLQALMDEAAAGSLGSAWKAPVSVIVCGSAMSVMTGILSGTSPMRGRASLDMALAPFDFRQAGGYWGITDPEAAFEVDAIVGGAAGYKDLTASAGVPERLSEVADWLCATVLNPSHALFREDEYLLREDPRVTVEAPYYSLLQAIAAGGASQGRIAESVGRSPGDIVHQLNVMTSAGFVVRDDDLLTARRPVYRIADPIVRFHHLVTRRSRAMLEDRRAAEVWAGAVETFRSRIVGPHLESLCRRWVDRYAAPDTLGGLVAPPRRLQVNDRSRRQSFELDVASVSAADATAGSHHTTVQVLGEAKAKRLGSEDLTRLDRIAELLDARPTVSVSSVARRLLFSIRGFSADLQSAAKHRGDVELIDLDRLYGGD